METDFYIAGAVAVISTIVMLTRLNLVHALLYLIVSLLAVAVDFFALALRLPRRSKHRFTPAPSWCFSCSS